MTSVCISNCVNDARDPRVPVRATYVNLYKWPESDAEFIKSVRHVGQGLHGHPRVVDNISCRQMYLRSYTFSRKESMPKKTKKCFGRVKEKMTNCGGGGKKRKDQNGHHRDHGRRKCLVFRKVKGALFTVFHRLLSCGASVDVVDQKD